MNDWMTAATIMTSLALAFGVLLALAYRFLKVEEDPRLDEVEEMLPGTNCGACGQPGCRAFAEKLVLTEVTPGQCTVSNPEAVESIAGYLGVEAGFVEKQVARLHCAGGEGSVRNLAEYRGIPSCRAAVLVNGGGRACQWGCLGLADCEVVCDFDAIHMSATHLPVVDADACTACGDCVEVCPLNLFTLEPLAQKLVVQCASPLRGEAARSVCTVACDACERCVLDAPPGVLEMVNGLPVIKRPDQTTMECTFRCPTGAIQWVEGNQFNFENKSLQRKSNG
jgi:Na+-translocating ferredoxin:NAD+ oxidoreductase RNF subunit RnfB